MWWLYNWKTGTYDYQSTYAMPTSATSVTTLSTAIGADVANYVSSVGKVSAVFRAHIPLRGTTRQVFQLKQDQMQLMYG